MSTVPAQQDSAFTISRIIFGVRFEPQYKVRDSVGAVIDAVLHARGTPFGPEVFPLSEANAQGHRLVNLETDDALTIATSDALLDFRVDTASFAKIADLAGHFDAFVIAPLRKLSSVSSVHRYGLVARFDNPPIHPTQRYADPDLPPPRNLAIRFSYRLPTEEGYSRQGVDDYRNVIYSLAEDEGRRRLSLDYQEYFDPSLEGSNLDRRTFRAFAEQAITYHRRTFTDWIQKLSRVGRAA